MENTTQNTALLVMDMQLGILGRLGDGNPVIANVAKAISAARADNIPVIYVVVGFRPGAPEVASENKSFAAGKPGFANADMNAFMTIIPEVAPQAQEVTVIKRRYSAFTGSDLEVMLRAYGVKHMVLTGVSTSGVVLSTVREAADKDYRLTVLSDACTDPDTEVHTMLVTKIFPRQADVVTVEEWIKSINQ